MKTINLNIQTSATKIIFKDSLSTNMFFRSKENPGKIYKVKIYHKLPISNYPIRYRPDSFLFLDDKDYIIEVATQCQRYIMFLDTIEAKGEYSVEDVYANTDLKLKSSDYFISGIWPPIRTSLDHSCILDLGDDKWVILDSTYSKIDNEDTDNWESIWLPRRCDPYYTRVTYARLTKHVSSPVNLKELERKVKKLNFIEVVPRYKSLKMCG